MDNSLLIILFGDSEYGLSGLRILAFLFWFLTFVVSMIRFRNHRIGGRDFLLFQAIGFGFLAFSLFPKLSSIFIILFNWRHGENAPLISVLFGAQFLLFFLFMNIRAGLYAKEKELNKLVHALGVKEFQRERGQFAFAPILVLIPAYHEEEAIGEVLRRMPKQIAGQEVDVLVIVDGFGDPSEQVARQHNVYVASNMVNRGYGSALQLGFLLAEIGGAKYLVTMDADGQHQPEEVEKVVAPVVAGTHDFVIGSRKLGFGAHISTLRTIGLTFFNYVLRLLVKTPTTDCSSGFRAFLTQEVVRLRLEEFQYQTAEVIIEASSKGLRIGEVPITITPRISGTTKKGSDLRFGVNFFRAMMKAWIRQKR